LDRVDREAVEEEVDAKVEVGKWRGDGRAEVGVGVADVDGVELDCCQR